LFIHDGVFLRYRVDFLKKELLIDFKTVEDDLVTVSFKGYFAHSFDHVMAGSVLYDIEKVDWSEFLKTNKSEFEEHKNYSWPIIYDDLDEFEHHMQENNYQCYIITSAIGLSGYVFAKGIE